VITQAKSNSRLTLQAVQALIEHGETSPAIIHDRVDFAGSMIGGGSVLESDPKGRSAEEIQTLWLFVKARISDKAKRINNDLVKSERAHCEKQQALTSQSIVRKAVAAPDAKQRGEEETQTKKIVDLNFKVDISFRREFKHLANLNDLKTSNCYNKR
jgi:hypothetical protein